jgi:hypothetical protein
MSRAQAVAYMTKQIDNQLESLIIANDYVGSVRINTNVKPGEYSQCLGDQKYPLGPVNGKSREALANKYAIEYTSSTSGGGKASNDFIREYTAMFDDGTVIKANNGTIDLFFRGQPWFADNGIQGVKLSIGSANDKGTNTTQKRGE